MSDIPLSIVDYSDSIPLIFGWADDGAATDAPPSLTPITLVGTAGVALNVRTEQLCYFTLIQESTGLPVTGYNPAYLLLNTTSANINNLTYPTTGVFTIQSGPDANGYLAPGYYTVVAEYDSTGTTDSTIKPLRKKVFARVQVKSNARGDANPI